MIEVALDTNMLVYFAGVQRVEADRDKIAIAEAIIKRLDSERRIVVPVQALGECYNAMLKSGFTRDYSETLVAAFAQRFRAASGGLDAMLSAIHLATQHKLQIWDSLIIVAAAHAGCRYLVSEDMQDGFEWKGVTVLNPFSEHAETALFG